MTVVEVGVHGGVDAELYHSDPCEAPSLSASVANILVSASPAHARAAHPRLNSELVREEDAKFDLGTAAHDLLLRGNDLIAECDFPDWRTKDAKIARDEARAAGRLPLLPDHAARVRQMVDAIRRQLETHTAQPPLFSAGAPEQMLVWEDDHGVTCRALLDWLRTDSSAIDDLKTTGASAAPFRWQKTMYGIGADVQVAFYERGVERLTGIRPLFRYVVVETYPPYALSVVDLAPSALAIGRDKVQKAIDLWAACLANDSWPAYDSRVASIDVPTWEELRWLERQEEAA